MARNVLALKPKLLANTAPAVQKYDTDGLFDRRQAIRFGTGAVLAYGSLSVCPRESAAWTIPWPIVLRSLGKFFLSVFARVVAHEIIQAIERSRVTVRQPSGSTDPHERYESEFEVWDRIAPPARDRFGYFVEVNRLLRTDAKHPINVYKDLNAPEAERLAKQLDCKGMPYRPVGKRRELTLNDCGLFVKTLPTYTHVVRDPIAHYAREFQDCRGKRFTGFGTEFFNQRGDVAQDLLIASSSSLA